VLIRSVAVRLAAGAAAVVVVAGCSGDKVTVTTTDDGSDTKPLALLEVGQCVTSYDINDTPSGDVLIYPCPRPAAPYELASRGPLEAGCPDGKRSPETAYTTLNLTDDPSVQQPHPVNVVYCFALNLVPESCYTVDPANYFSAADCSAPARQERLKAVKQLDGNQNAVCDPGQERYAWPVPPRVVCLAPAP
jgi:hypothetical protein